MSDRIELPLDAQPRGVLDTDRSGAVPETHRAVILVHGFLHVVLAVPLAAFWWRSATAMGHLAVLLTMMGGIGVGGFELYLSAYTGERSARLARAIVGVYTLLAIAAFLGTLFPPYQLGTLTAAWWSILSLGPILSNHALLAIVPPELLTARPVIFLTAVIQGLIPASAIVLTCAIGRRTLIASAPAWLLPWLLAHGIRSVVGAAYYLTYDIGAEPLWRWIEGRPRRQVLMMLLGGLPLAALGAMLAWGLLLLGRWFIPPILHPLLYLVGIDLVLLPLLPPASFLVFTLFRKLAARDECWVFVLSPVFVALAPLAALVLSWLAIHRVLVRLAGWVGRWQLGPMNPWVQGLLGAVWVHLAIWLLATALNAETGLMLIGRQVPGAEAFRQNQRTFLPNLPPEMRAARDFLVGELSRIGIEKEDGEAMRAASLLSGEHPDAGAIRFRDLSPWTQRRLAGLPWYYSPAEFEKDRVERCVVFWGCLLLAVMTLVRWPGLHAVLRYGVLRGLLCIGRLVAPTVAVAACLVGTSGQPDLIALFSGVGLVALGALALIFWLGWLVSRDTGATPHYAPFMAIRLLQKRRIAFFAIGAVTLCVAMVLIVISVMGGFLDLVRERSHGLLGDLVMENGSLQGFAGYEEFISRIKQLRDEKGRRIVEEATPVIYTYGVLRFPVSYVTKPVRVVGIRIAESVRVTRFGESLNFEKFYPGTTRLDRQQQPCWGWDTKKLAVLPEPYEKARAKWLATVRDPDVLKEYERFAGQEYPGPGLYADYSDTDAAIMYRTLKDVASELQMIGEDVVEARWPASADAATSASRGSSTSPTTTGAAPTSMPSLSDRAMKQAARLEQLTDRLPESPEAQAQAGPLLKLTERIMTLSDQLRTPNEKVGQTINDILKQLQGPIEKSDRTRTQPGYGGKFYHGVIIGRDLIATREASGQYRRYDTYPRGAEMLVSVLPLTPKGTFTLQEPISLPLRYVDDSRTGVYDIDSICVYVDFTMLQRTMEMGRQRLKDGSGTTSPRASQVLIKLTPGQNVFARREQLKEEWTDFCRNWPHVRDLHMMGYVEFHTWEEQQAQFIAAVEKEKILVTTLFAVVSAVAIFLVLCIFYMIVTEKTRDIGTLKSIGATAGGVAGVFLAYGAAIGVVGASLGLWIGTVFVRHINGIQDWMARISPGMRIWSAEVYTFDVIPDKVKFEDAAVIFVVAIIASVLGATFPALRAGRTWPVEALRYE